MKKEPNHQKRWGRGQWEIWQVPNDTINGSAGAGQPKSLPELTLPLQQTVFPKCSRTHLAGFSSIMCKLDTVQLQGGSGGPACILSGFRDGASSLSESSWKGELWPVAGLDHWDQLVVWVRYSVEWESTEWTASYNKNGWKGSTFALSLCPPVQIETGMIVGEEWGTWMESNHFQVSCHGP